MIRGGLKRTELDKRDYSLHRSFGTIAVPLPLLDYDYDIGKTMPDQNADGKPFGCRAYTITEIAGDEDNTVYDIDRTCKRIAMMEGTPDIQGGDIRIGAKCGKVYGMRKVGEADNPPFINLRGAFYNVDKVAGYDWFDSFRSGLRVSKAPISTGTIWFSEWEQVGQDGLLTSNFVFDGTWDTEGGHNYAITGEKTINGQPTLRVKSWQGRNYGDNGWCYMDRATFNKAFDIYGTVGLTQAKAAPQDIYTIKLDVWQWILLYLGRWIGLKAHS